MRTAQKPPTFDVGKLHGMQWFKLNAVPLARNDPHLNRFIENWPPSARDKPVYWRRHVNLPKETAAMSAAIKSHEPER